MNDRLVIVVIALPLRTTVALKQSVLSGFSSPDNLKARERVQTQR
jgi:hypothetical protein